MLALVKAGFAGDKKTLRTVTEALIAEENSKQHKVLATRLNQIIQKSDSNPENTLGLQLLEYRRASDKFVEKDYKS